MLLHLSLKALGVYLTHITYLQYLRHFATLLESSVANRPIKVVSNIESVFYSIFFNVYFLVYLVFGMVGYLMYLAIGMVY